MIEQQARVLRADGSKVLVSIGGQSGCTACDAGKGCGAGLFGKLLRRNRIELELANRIGASAGQSVRLGLAQSLFLKLVFRVYGWPLVVGFAGAVLGYQSAVANGLGSGWLDLATFTGAFTGLALVLIFWNRTSKPDICSSDIYLLDSQNTDTVCDVANSKTHD